MTINKQKPIYLFNKCSCVVDKELLSKAILWKSNAPVQSNKSIYLFGNYAAVSIGQKKYHVHRLLMEYIVGCKLSRNLSVHHINGNKLDNSVDNLAIMVGSSHNKKHMKGVKFTKEHSLKIAEANRKRKGIKMKKRVNIPLDELEMLLKHGRSINYISGYYGCDWSTVKSRINENPELLEDVE